ncbi:hypothetical protein ACFL3V_07150 [Nanoarchaeota archaeon]
MMNKKAQGMSLRVIIIAVIALIVLVVLIMVFAGKLKFFGGQTSDTASRYTGTKCEIPGTNNECGLSETACRAKGGTYDSKTNYDLCADCCLM